ncbi:MAG: hypothetical protein HKN03_07640 [Acidimicrobiales bacterium]|nr:hypothetical protein [Acidimicrobiales bacterium]
MVISFPIWDSLIHSWDISAAVGRPIELSAEARDAISVVMDSPYADGARHEPSPAWHLGGVSAASARWWSAARSVAA